MPGKLLDILNYLFDNFVINNLVVLKCGVFLFVKCSTSSTQQDTDSSRNITGDFSTQNMKSDIHHLEMPTGKTQQGDPRV